MATDILTNSATATAHRHHFPLSDLDLRDDRYPIFSPTRHVPQPLHQVSPSVNIIPPHTPFYPNAVHQAARGTSLPSSDLSSHAMNMGPQPDIQDEPHTMHHPETLSSPPTSYPLDHVQPTNTPPSVNEINMQLFGPSQTSQASSGDVSKPPPTDDAPVLRQPPRPLQLVPPRQTSSQDSQSPELSTPPRSGAATGQTQAIPFPSPLSQGMRMSTMAQYSPAMTIPVSPAPRVQAQQPTYITPTPTPNPINPVFTTPLHPEEVCVECAMRDQDMADVDVTSPGVWSRESDVHFEDLLRRELEEEALGVPCQEPQRPRARGGRLTEANLKLWLSLNPKEPASKGEALEKYVKMQRTLVEAEALAHARALQESRQLEDRMRDAYTQLRRSAYELGVTTSPDDRGVRIKTLRSSILPLSSQMSGHNREVTVLENGMIVEHVDVRKEEREQREQRRREEKRARARKSSRGSAIDIASMYSNMSPVPHTDSGFPLLPSRSSTSRPMSVLTSPMETFPRGTLSSTSVEALSMVSAGPSPNRRMRFFGARNLSTGFRSSDSLAPSGFSGSMVDMHVALQHGGERLTHSPVESGDRYQTMNSWQDSSVLLPRRGIEQKPEGKSKKKGLAKIWRLVTRTPRHGADAPPHDASQTRSVDRTHDDDYPLTPPPPLSYLVSRGTVDNGGSALRHVSMPSLQSTSSNFPLSSAGMSPPTPPSSLLPSPTSSRPVVALPESSESRKAPPVDGDGEQLSSVPQEERLQAPTPQRSVHPTASEPDLRSRVSQVPNTPVPTAPRIPISAPQTNPPPSTGWRDKVLPPLPGEAQPRPPTHAQADVRPHTLFSYDMCEVDSGQVLTAPEAPFAGTERRRQSFNGLNNPPSGLVVQTMPSSRLGFYPEKYGEFGASRSALVSSSLAMQQPPKRKSRFSFASLLGRKPSAPVQDSEPVEFPLGRWSGSEARHEAEMGMHYGNMANGEAGQDHVFPRMTMSLTTRKNIEALVDQSPDFVAYRYPSGDQNLQLLR